MSQFLTTRELAAMLRVKERKVYELAAEGALPVHRVTGKLLFPRVEIEDIMSRLVILVSKVKRKRAEAKASLNRAFSRMR